MLLDRPNWSADGTPSVRFVGENERGRPSARQRAQFRLVLAVAAAPNSSVVVHLTRDPLATLAQGRLLYQGFHMRRIALVGLMALVAGCTSAEGANGTAPDRMTAVTGPRRTLAGGIPAAAAAAAGARPIDGSGTTGVVPTWTAPTSLGVSPLRIDANGDLVLRPGAAIIVVSADGTKCYRIGGESIVHAVAGGCPTVWP